MVAPVKSTGGSEGLAGRAAKIAAKEATAPENMEMEDIENELDARVRDDLARDREFLAKTAGDAEVRRSGAQNSTTLQASGK